MKTETQNSSKQEVQNENLDHIQELINQGKSLKEILSLGYLKYEGNYAKANEEKIWNYSIRVIGFLHMVISETTKTSKERSNAKVSMGVQMALGQIVALNKEFPNVKLIHEKNGDDYMMSLGYVGLLEEEHFKNLPIEKKNLMLRITNLLNNVLSNFLNGKGVLGSLTNELREITKHTDSFHKNNHATLFHALHPII